MGNKQNNTKATVLTTNVTAPKPPKHLDLAHLFAEQTTKLKTHPLLSVPISIPYGTYSSSTCILLDDNTLAIYNTDNQMLSVYDTRGDTKLLLSKPLPGFISCRYMNPVINKPNLILIGDDVAATLFDWEKFHEKKQIDSSYVYSVANNLLFVHYQGSIKMFNVEKLRVHYSLSSKYNIVYACLGSGRRVVALIQVNDQYRYATFEINGVTSAPVVTSANPVTPVDKFVVLNEEVAAFPSSQYIQLWNYVSGNIYGTFQIKESTMNKAPALLPVGRDHLIRTYKKRYNDINVNEWIIELWCWKRDFAPQVLYKNRTTTGVCVKSPSSSTVMISMPTDPLNVLICQVKDGTGDMSRKLLQILAREAFSDIVILR